MLSDASVSPPQTPFRLDHATGLVAPAKHVPSPNCDARPHGVVVELIVVHAISLPPGEFGGGFIEQLFLNTLDPAQHPYFEAIANLTVSAHFLIARDGVLTQFVPVHQRAWHAGRSAFRGRTACNDFSIGIELEGIDNGAYTPAQYATLNGLAETLCATLPGLTERHAVGHSEIAPGRKTDPGPGFDWHRVPMLTHVDN